MYNKFFIVILFLLAGMQLFAQKTTGFNLYKNFSIKGDSRVIGNNIVSLHTTNPYNDVGYKAKKNDRLPMVYIDIDNDSNTFSSSSANMTIPESASSIAYAALYWAAIYEYEEAEMKRRRTGYEFVPVKPRVETFNKVLLKTPEGEYKPVQGSVLEDYKDSIGRPYLCYAEITDILKSTSKTSGIYTVANVRATQGHILGGSSGGWMMYVVYKDESLSKKEFTLFNGFQSVEKSEFELNILARDSLSTSITLGVLEGDERLKTDEISLKYSEEALPQAIASSVRPAHNFFNSSITINDEVFIERNPNSLNTLGFDIASFNLPIKKTNLEDEVKLNLKTVRDKFLLFFTALQTNVEETKAPLSLSTERQLAIQDSTPKVDNDTILLKSIKVKQTLKVPSQSTGYYLITNVFSEQRLANNWKQHLEKDGFNPKSFVNSKNSWEYVYINYSEKVEDLYADYTKYKKKDLYKEIWILEIKD